MIKQFHILLLCIFIPASVSANESQLSGQLIPTDYDTQASVTVDWALPKNREVASSIPVTLTFNPSEQTAILLVALSAGANLKLLGAGEYQFYKGDEMTINTDLLAHSEGELSLAIQVLEISGTNEANAVQIWDLPVVVGNAKLKAAKPELPKGSRLVESNGEMIIEMKPHKNETD